MGGVSVAPLALKLGSPYIYMSLVVLITFEDFYKKIIERFHEYKINYVEVHFKDLEKFLKTNKTPIKIFFVTGSTRRILRDGIHPSIDSILKMPVPVIGICYGFQYMAMRSGGVLEDGAVKTKMTSMPGTVGKDQNLRMWVNHFDKIKSLPVSNVAKNAEMKIIWKIDSVVDGTIYMAHTDKWIGFQFHPEYKKSQFEEFILPFVK
jgi:GMP synthase-like glutamine amidotransferase